MLSVHLPEVVGDQVRLGVAVEVPEPYSTLVQAERARLGDPLAYSIAPHVTIIPPTVVEPDQVPEVQDHVRATAAAHPPFPMVLRGSGSFRPVSPVVFVRVEAGAQRCAELERDCRTGPLARTPRFDYYPHVTVAHEIADPALDEAERSMASFEAMFAICRLSLYLHDADGVWRRRQTYPLGRRG